MANGKEYNDVEVDEPLAKRKLPKTVIRKRVVKTVFWMGIAYLFFCVSILMFRPEDGVKAEAEVLQPVQNPATEAGVETFAVNFASQYFTWGQGDKAFDDRKNRLQPYLASYVDSQAGLNIKKMTSKSTFLKSQVWKVEDAGSDRSKVTLRSQYAVTANGRKETKLNYMVVPVASDGQNFVVYDIPYFVQEPKKFELDQKDGINRSNVLHQAQMKAEIRDFLDSFFKVYASGKQEEISYFTKNVNVQGLSGILTYKGIGDISIYTNLESEGIYQVEVQVTYGDSKGATLYTYPYYVEVRKESSRWFVVNFEQK
ncbi:hypothetical protein BK138_34460 [Paenibacillus rhizosphaerae]|uniref:Conjugal transfer protein n=1 Tax=Paenibacillus rhizosphaerae TaxID=297318 RepID=A0A1R1DZ04_9BACL|nr:conjugal transfer protein [Paenibacillus rhizosphaerae]OMF44746.1 hypothetical protein BK138_34460 [Paenibacillus rhizosphaerae]